MNEKTKFRIVDGLLLAMMIVPFVLAMALKVATKPVEEGISITGALIYFTVPMPLQDLYITEAQVNSLAVIIALLGLCLYMTHGIAVVPGSKRQLAAEWVVEKVSTLVSDNVGRPVFGLCALCVRHSGSQRLFQPEQPAGPVPAYVGYQHRGGLGHPGLHPDYLL